MKKSMPTPLSTILPAVFFHPGCSVWNSFLSVSIPCKSFLSLKNSLPGPHVGRADKEQTIFPPVACNADTAESSTGSKMGSGFLTWEKSVGSCVKRDVITDLPSQQNFTLKRVRRPTLTRRGLRITLRCQEERRDPQCQASPASALAQGLPRKRFSIQQI